MLAQYSYAPSTHEDALFIGENMRQADRDEIMAASGMDHVESIILAQRYADHCWTARVNGDPVVMFGVKTKSLMLNSGCPWLLATEEMERHPIEVMRASRQYIDMVKSLYDILENYVDTRHEVSIRWLQHFGFEIDLPIKFGFQEMYFHKFFWHRWMEVTYV